MQFSFPMEKNHWYTRIGSKQTYWSFYGSISFSLEVSFIEFPIRCRVVLSYMKTPESQEYSGIRTDISHQVNEVLGETEGGRVSEVLLHK